MFCLLETQQACLYFCSVFSFLVFQGSQQSERVSGRASPLWSSQEWFYKQRRRKFIKPQSLDAHVKHQLRIVEFEPRCPPVRERPKRCLVPSLTVQLKPFLTKPLGAIAQYDCGRLWYDLEFCRVRSVRQLWECRRDCGEFEQDHPHPFFFHRMTPCSISLHCITSC